MKCSDCMSYELCSWMKWRSWIEHGDTYAEDVPDDRLRVCRFFKDKAKFIEIGKE